MTCYFAFNCNKQHDIDSFYGKFIEQEEEAEQESWETEYENIYDSLSPEIKQDARRIPHRSRVLRKWKNQEISLITYAKRGSVNIFWVVDAATNEVSTITDEDAFWIFRAELTEEWYAPDERFYELYDTLRNSLFHTRPGGKVDGQVKKALESVDRFSDYFPKEYRTLLKKVINEYDSLPDQYMVQLREISEHNYKDRIPHFQKLVSIEYLHSIESKVREYDELAQDLIMSEQFA